MQQKEQKKNFIKVKNKIEDSDANQLAYAFNLNSWILTISNNGHGEITRGKDRRDFCGGWVWRDSRRITYACGLLRRVPKKLRSIIKSSMEDEFRFFLKEG